MKLNQAYLVIGVWFASSVFAGQSLVCLEPLKDFGVIEEGKRYSHTFIIQNASTKFIDVNEIIPSCGCIVTSKKAFILNPNECTDIKIEFDSSDAGGMIIYKTISICSKNQKEKSLVLTVKADVKGIPPQERITLLPSQMILDGIPYRKYIFRLQIPSDPNVNFSIDVPQWLDYSLQKSRFNDFANVVNWDVEIFLKTNQQKKLSGDIIISSNLKRFEKVIMPIKVEPKPVLIIKPYMVTFDRNDPNQNKEVIVKPTKETSSLVLDSLEIKSSKACVEMNWTNDGKVIHLMVINKACDKGFGKIEIKKGDDVIGMIPVIFK